MSNREPDPRPGASRRHFLLALTALGASSCVSRRYGSGGEAAALGTGYEVTPVGGGDRGPRLPPTAQRAGVWYEVRPGDTLLSIARGGGLEVESIVRANRLSSASLAPGQRLWLPELDRLPTALSGAAARAPRPDNDDDLVPSGRADKGAAYRIVRRREWTDGPIGPNRQAIGAITRLTVHHTGEYAGTATLPDREIIRRIDRYHREGRRWACIGYHYLVGRDGTIYEGRPERFQGAHTSGENENNLGISVMGDFHRGLPNATQLRALSTFLDDTRRRLKVPTSRIYGHRQLSPSICPGDALYGWLVKYRQGRSA
jgi:LysM repeat protein